MAKPELIEKPVASVLQGNCFDTLKTLPKKHFHTAISSVPYWQVRDYDVEGQHGLEETLDQWLDRMVQVHRRVRRTLRDDGTLWVNIGDNYIDGGLVGQPWELALALRDDGWILRSDIIWSKPNSTPEPGNRKRPAMSHEYIFLLVKSKEYFYDGEAIKEPSTALENSKAKPAARLEERPDKMGVGNRGFGHQALFHGLVTRNKRTVWNVAAGGAGEEGHFAAFPEDLVKPMILAGTSEYGCCSTCGAPFQRVMDLTELGKKVLGKQWHDRSDALGRGQRNVPPKVNGELRYTKGWEPTCKCAESRVPCRVLDYYSGSGTTGMVALKHGRSYQGLELNPEYVKLSRKRLARAQSQSGRVTTEQLKEREELGLMSSLEASLFNE